jgi:hypothetical protein
MARLVPIALFLAFAPAAAWPQSTPVRDFSIRSDASRAPPDGQFRLRSDSHAELSDPNFAGTELAPNTMLGIGTFGLKRDRSYQAPVTVRDIATSRTRRPGVGLRLKF